MAKRNFKRLLVVSDFHCGHLTGLTPPDWWWGNTSETAWRKKVCEYQQWAWNEYISYLDIYRPYDRLLVLGDCVDGKGKLAGGNEQLTTDRDEQVQMAIACIKATKISTISIVRGTQYHTGVDEDWENAVARGVKAEIGNHLYIIVKPFTISAKHFVGGSQVPQSKATSIMREQITNDQWVREYENHPKANIFLRGHIHRSVVVDEPKTLSCVVPGLQGWTDFGSRKCSMPVHFGIMAIDIHPNGERQWYRKTAELGQHIQVINW